ncbi:hypothetical protein COCNU_scaffold008927G000010 [Cocos nucifera]|nr:hypothetical protein [Cocos nucifera]
MASATTDAAPEVCPGDEAILIACIDIVEGESLPPKLANLLSRDCTPDPSATKEKGRRKKKAAIVKKACKVRPNEPDQGSITYSWQSGYYMLAHLKRANRLKVEVLKVREDLQAKINHLQAMVAKAKRLMGEKTVESSSPSHGGVQDLLRNERPEHRLQPEGVHQWLSALRRRVARRFSELNLDFLKVKEEAGEEARSSSTEANLSSTKPATEVLEPIESAPPSSTTAPPEVEDLE